MQDPLEDGPGEVWKDVPGFKGVYQVSSLGRVKSLPRKCGRGKHRRAVPGRIMRIVPHVRDGVVEFASVRLQSPRGFTRQVSITRLVLMVFKGRPPHRGAIALTRDGDPLNPAISNLYWGTFRQAAQRAVRRKKASPSTKGSASSAFTEVCARASKVYRAALKLKLEVRYERSGWFSICSPGGEVLRRLRANALEDSLRLLAGGLERKLDEEGRFVGTARLEHSDLPAGLAGQ